MADYEAVDVRFNGEQWGGLEASNEAGSWIDGSVDTTNWYSSVCAWPLLLVLVWLRM